MSLTDGWHCWYRICWWCWSQSLRHAGIVTLRSDNVTGTDLISVADTVFVVMLIDLLVLLVLDAKKDHKKDITMVDISFKVRFLAVPLLCLAALLLYRSCRSHYTVFPGLFLPVDNLAVMIFLEE